MFAASESPEILTPAALDSYLERGWFRMNQTIFTTHFIQFLNKYYAAIWLRISLPGYMPDSKHTSAIKRNSIFRTEICKAEITRAHEALYEMYKTGVSFNAYSSLKQLLLSDQTTSIYDTWQVNVYDGSTLIASGYFDIGANSAEGIVSIYHPGYKKYSLGKYLIYSKMDHCRQQGLTYFYPGYAVPGYPAFDYKLELGKAAMQYYNVATNQWIPFATPAQMYNPLDEMREKLRLLHTKLTLNNVASRLLYYRFFDGALNIRFWGNLLEYPIFLLADTIYDEQAPVTVVVYNIVERCYMLLECTPVYRTDADTSDKEIFSSDILSVDQHIYDTSDADKMVAVLKWNNRHFNA